MRLNRLNCPFKRQKAAIEYKKPRLTAVDSKVEDALCSRTWSPPVMPLSKERGDDEMREIAKAWRKTQRHVEDGGCVRSVVPSLAGVATAAEADCAQ